jgi:hypothetical protein
MDKYVKDIYLFLQAETQEKRDMCSCEKEEGRKQYLKGKIAAYDYVMSYIEEKYASLVR